MDGRPLEDYLLYDRHDALQHGSELINLRGQLRIFGNT
jgi:hypothetical protein